jgi:uncharacterized LabA/DUF88 family protein
MDREIVAILVDGEFYLKRAKNIWGEKTPIERADELVSYCRRHLKDHEGDQEIFQKLYRIFFYDCPPSDKNVYHPLLKKTICLKNSPTYAWRNEFHRQLKQKRKVALRLGRLSGNEYFFTLSADATKKLVNKVMRVEDLSDNDLINNIGQKGVDMRLGLDIQSMALKRQVTRMVLISGDSDFVPAAKEARREGIDFILDPLWWNISADLSEHIDGLESKCAKPNSCDILKDPLYKKTSVTLKQEKAESSLETDM